MEPYARARGYDLFKLIVAILLLILFLFLLWRGKPGSPIPTATLAVPTHISSFTSILTSTSTPHEITATAILDHSPTVTQMVETTLSPTRESTLTLTTEATATPTLTPEITATIPVQVDATLTPTETAQPPSNASTCEEALAISQLQVSQNATILRRLNFRSSPGIGDNWLLTHRPGAQVKVIGGPTCLPHYVGAYVWWQLELPDGRTGWSAEASLHGTFYFMEPVR